jgi:hypothetical protein
MCEYARSNVQKFWGFGAHRFYGANADRAVLIFKLNLVAVLACVNDPEILVINDAVKVLANRADLSHSIYRERLTDALNWMTKSCFKTLSPLLRPRFRSSDRTWLNRPPLFAYYTKRLCVIRFR